MNITVCQRFFFKEQSDHCQTLQVASILNAAAVADGEILRQSRLREIEKYGLSKRRRCRWTTAIGEGKINAADIDRRPRYLILPRWHESDDFPVRNSAITVLRRCCVLCRLGNSAPSASCLTRRGYRGRRRSLASRGACRRRRLLVTSNVSASAQRNRRSGLLLLAEIPVARRYTGHRMTWFATSNDGDRRAASRPRNCLPVLSNSNRSPSRPAATRADPERSAAHEAQPKLAFTSDFIVGFPGETSFGSPLHVRSIRVPAPSVT